MLFQEAQKLRKVPAMLRSVEGTAEVDEEDRQGDFPVGLQMCDLAHR